MTSTCSRRYGTWLNLLVEAVTPYRDWLERSQVQKVLFYAQPGALVPAGVVDWWGGSRRRERHTAAARGRVLCRIGHLLRLPQPTRSWRTA